MTLGSARRAVAFLTPVGGAAAPTPSTLAWFPVVGAAIGAVLGLVWWGMSFAWPAGVAAAVVVAADLVLTGMLHIDGLVDAADGLLPHLSRARRLEVMADPRAGAFGITAGAAVLLLRWAALFSLKPQILLLVGLWAASRATMAVVATVVPYARAAEGGLASAFMSRPAVPGTPADPGTPNTAISDSTAIPGIPAAQGTPPVPGGTCSAALSAGRARHLRDSRLRVLWRRRAEPGMAAGALGAAIALACVIAWDPLPGIVALAAGTLAAAGVVRLAVRRVGGFTGDVLGAAGLTLETVALIVAAARW